MIDEIGDLAPPAGLGYIDNPETEEGDTTAYTTGATKHPSISPTTITQARQLMSLLVGLLYKTERHKKHSLD